MADSNDTTRTSIADDYNGLVGPALLALLAAREAQKRLAAALQQRGAERLP